MSEKFDVKKHNLSHRLMRAMLNNKHDEVCEIAQEVFDADYELEDLNLLPITFKLICIILEQKGWSPSIKNQLDA